MKKLLLIIILLALIGCAKNPIGPLPPIENKAGTFEEHLNRLSNPGYTYFWVKQFTKYDLRGQLGWDWEAQGMPDLAYSLAYSMWNTCIHGDNLGVCGQFAATYVVAARVHGYDAGFTITYVGSSGHAKGWIIDKDGTIWITDNDQLQKTNYKSKKELFDDFANSWFNKDYGYGYVANDKMEIIYDESGWHNPVSIKVMKADDRKRLINSIGYKE